MRALTGEASPAARALARSEIAEALRQDPHNVLAQAVRTFALEETVDLATARALTSAEPDSWLAWLVRHRAEGGTLNTVEGRRAAVTARAAGGGPTPRSSCPSDRKARCSTGAALTLPACPDASGLPARNHLRGSRGLEACPSGRALTSDDALAELRAIVTSDVSWCFFELASWQPLTVAIDIDERGQAASICLDRPPPDQEMAACVTPRPRPPLLPRPPRLPPPAPLPAGPRHRRPRPGLRVCSLAWAHPQPRRPLAFNHIRSNRSGGRPRSCTRTSPAAPPRSRP